MLTFDLEKIKIQENIVENLRHTQNKYMHIVYKFLLWKARNIILNTAKALATLLLE